MNANRLSELIKHPENLGKSDLDALQSILADYPFFGIGHMLVLRGLERNNDPEYKSVLKKSAIHVADRSALYRFLKQNSPEDSDESEVITDPTEIVSEPINEKEVSHHLENGAIHSETAIENIQEIDSEDLEAIFAGMDEEIPEKKFHDVIDNSEEIVISEKAPQIHETDQDREKVPLEEEILAEESNSVENEEVDLPSSFHPTFKLDQAEPIQLGEAESPDVSTENFGKSTFIEPLPFSIDSKSEDKPVEEIPSEKKVHNDTVQGSTSVAAPEEKEAPIASNRMKLGSFNSWLKQKLEAKPAEKEIVEEKRDKPTSGEEDKSADLITKFISTEPKIGKPKSEFFNPIDVGRKSLVDDESYVTVTLAEVYAAQGDFEKAISVYKKLTLKYPDKNSIFAARIYELEIKSSLQ